MQLVLQGLFETNSGALSQLRAHAQREQPSESVGRLVVHGERQTVLRYEPLVNEVATPDRDVWRVAGGWASGIGSGEGAVLVHSHPITPPHVSLDDLQGANPGWFGQLYAIYSIPLDDLAVYFLTPGLNFPVAYVRLAEATTPP